MALLRDLHGQLESHFRTLREARSASGGHPIFLLEHGFTAAQLDTLSSEIRATILREKPSKVFYLPWLVYAAELGYRFAGEEYWQTFEQETPAWKQNGSREWVREAFGRFAAIYRGARPEGRWANHFSIIAWPITHAILPRDLQRQLAQALYDLRWVLRVEHLNDPDRLGHLIRSRAGSGSSRFATFAQDAPLVGQIAAALLLRDASQTSHLIHTPALGRIAEDLDRERVARSWLEGARVRARQVQLRGVTLVEGARASAATPPSRGGGASTGPAGPAPASYSRSTLGIDPRLSARPEGNDRWTLELEIPALQHLLVSPEWAELLGSTRCRVAGGPRRPLAPGRLLSGIQRIVLERWPRPDDVLLEFDGASPAVKAALKTTALLPPGPTWLFKRGGDGRSHHIRGHVARPGAGYLLVSTEPIDYDSNLRPVELSCSGVYAGRFEVPEIVPPSVDGLLRSLGIQRASTIRVRPAGLPPLFWDGEGHIEWLTTDCPTIAIERESAEELELALAGDAAMSARIPGGTESPVYVQLPPLGAGAHTISVRALGKGVPTGPSALEVTVRAPRPWSGQAGYQHAVQVSTAPPEPTLEDLLLSRFRMEVRGPAGLPVASSATIWDYRRQNALYKKQLPPQKMPFDTAGWHRAFVRHFLDDQPAQAALERAWAIEVQFAFGGLSTQRIVFTRQLSPLRWAVKTAGRNQDVRLLDDTGLEGSRPVVTLRSFEEPGIETPVVLDAATGSVALAKSGGLLEARQGDHRVRAVIAPPSVQGLAGLKLTPKLPHFRAAPDGMEGLVSFARLWAGATPHGTSLSRMRQCEVLREIHACVVRSLCGARWDQAERHFLRDARQTAHALSLELTSDPKVRKTIREPLERAAAEFLALPSEARAERLHAIMAQVRDLRDLDIADTQFALEVLSVPERIDRPADRAWERLLKCSVLARAARFLIVTTHRASNTGDIVAIPLYAGWN
jgi:hypothetical protein